MAWSDAARAAALEARRRHLASSPNRKLHPITWYHGGPSQLKGKHINPTVSANKEPFFRSAFATTNIRDAIMYASQSLVARAGAVYIVKPSRAKKVLERNPLNASDRGLHLAQHAKLKVVRRLPGVFFDARMGSLKRR